MLGFAPLRGKQGSCQLLALQRLLGKKWAWPLLLEIHLLELQNKGVHFNQLKKRTANRINSSLLSLILKEFIRFNLLQKSPKERQRSGKEQGRKESIRYELTENGRNFLNILLQLKAWAQGNNIIISKDCQNLSCMDCGHFIECSGRSFQLFSDGVEEQGKTSRFPSR